ncbi:glycosyltransferase family 2 protein, partial [Candidatus Uhrbacteria bacterium]|nr:glycosyltransferase family 2 protein [Candidatus Uhrbacteria bacterium]
MHIIALIPAYNEEKTVADAVRAAVPFVDVVMVIDDGSADQTAARAHEAGARVIRHGVNRGLGAALGTGFAAARLLHADVAVTLDADGQHDAKEIPRFIKAVQEGGDLVIGNRMEAREGMPMSRQFAQLMGNLLTFFLFHVWVSDSQSGYRALSRHALGKMNIRTNRMEVSSEIVAEAKWHKLKIVEIPIKPIYTEYS